jgi:hypothetical protein
MIKTTVIRSQTIEEAKEIFGVDMVKEVFYYIQRKSSEDVLLDIQDTEIKKCLFFLIPDYGKK